MSLASKVFELPMELPPLKWLTRNIGVQMLLLLLVTLWALRRCGSQVLSLALNNVLREHDRFNFGNFQCALKHRK